jgi:hypothetical protein
MIDKILLQGFFLSPINYFLIFDTWRNFRNKNNKYDTAKITDSLPNFSTQSMEAADSRSPNEAQRGGGARHERPAERSGVGEGIRLPTCTAPKSRSYI